jgi:small-conductance mechanosensitive channel
VITIWISVVLSRIIHAVLEQDVLARVRLPRGVPGTISTMARYAVIAVGVLAAASAAGLELSQFAIIAGALGVGIGFGLQNLVNNFVSGLILVFERPIHIGDTVQTGTMWGRVQKIGIRSSVVRTWEGAEVIVPNGNLISSEVTNWTLSDRTRRMTVAVGVKYGTDPRKVKEVLLEAARRHEKVASFPEPYALFIGFGASSLDFELRFWTSHYDDWVVIRSEVTMNVNDGLAEAGIEIPFPQRDLHLRTIDAPWPESGASDDEYAKGG